MAAADVVVCHGGPGTMSLAQRCGHRPIVIARDPALGEHVDDHQQRYTAKLRSANAIESPASVEQLIELIRGARRREVVAGGTDPEVERAVQQFGELVESLVAGTLAATSLARPRARASGAVSTVVYLGAVGRSGTTLLERVAATSPRFVSLGEMVHLWERGALRRRAVRVRVCRSISARSGRRSSTSPSVGGRRSTRSTCARARNSSTATATSRSCCGRGSPVPGIRVALDEFLGVLDRLYAAIAQVAGPDVVLVDASKHPSYLFVLRRLPSHDVRLLHVVRDPRGVAHSWAKSGAATRVVERRRHGAARHVPGHRPMVEPQPAVLAGRHRGTARALLRYERFAVRPGRAGPRARRTARRPFDRACPSSMVAPSTCR